MLISRQRVSTVMALVLRNGFRIWSLFNTRRLYSSNKEVNPEVLKMIVCPLSKEKLRLNCSLHCQRPPFSKGAGAASIIGSRELYSCHYSRNVCICRYDKEANELVCHSLGVAYSIVNGIPNLMPQDARLFKDTKNSSPSNSGGQPVSNTD